MCAGEARGGHRVLRAIQEGELCLECLSPSTLPVSTSAARAQCGLQTVLSRGPCGAISRLGEHGSDISCLCTLSSLIKEPEPNSTEERQTLHTSKDCLGHRFKRTKTLRARCRPTTLHSHYLTPFPHHENKEGLRSLKSGKGGVDFSRRPTVYMYRECTLLAGTERYLNMMELTIASGDTLAHFIWP